MTAPGGRGGAPGRGLLGLAILVALGAPGAARGEAPLPGLPLASVRFEAPPREDLERLRALAALEPGSPYDAARIRRATELLFQLGRFENVLVHAREEGGAVHLRVELRPRPVLRDVRVQTSGGLDAGEVSELLGLSPGAELPAARLPGLRARLVDALRARGHRASAVGVAAVPVDDEGRRDLRVRIEAGPRTTLRRLVVRGEPRMPLWQLGRWLDLAPGAVIELDRVEAALARLREVYLDRGHLEVRIAPPWVREVPGGDPAAPVADLVLDVDAGPAVAVRYSGLRAVPRREVEDDADVLREQGTGPAALAELRERVLSRYERRGHWRARVDVAVRATVDRSRKEILVAVREGPAARVASLAFPGNDVLEPRVLEETVRDLVAEALSEETRRPGPDPRVVADVLGAGLGRPAAGAAPPEVRAVYLPRTYRVAREAIADLYRAEGYLLAAVGAPEAKERPPEPGRDPSTALVDVTIPVRPGVRWVVGAISFSGHDAVTGSELFDVARLDPARAQGQPLSFAEVEAARRAIVAHYRGLGHLYASVSEDLRQVPPRGSLASWGYVSTSSTAPLDVRAVCARAEAAGKDACEVEVVFRIDEGPEVRAREVVVRGLEHTGAAVVEDELAIVPGEVLREQDLATSRDNLLRVGVFERVVVQPVDEERPAARKDVVVEVRERRRHSLDLGVGASTEEGVRAFARYGDINLAGRAVRLQLQGKLNVWLPQLLLLYDPALRDRIGSFYDQFGTLGRLEYELAAGLAYPRVLGLPRGFSAGLDLTVFRDYDPAFAENTQTLLLMGTYKGLRPVIAGRPRPLALQLRTRFERSELQCNPEIDDRPELCSTALSDERNLRIQGSNAYVGVGPRVSWDFRDDPLDPRAGLYLELEAAAARGLDDRSPDHLVVDGRVTGFVPLFAGIGLAFSGHVAKVAALQDVDPAQGFAIPVNRRLFAGGRSTIRGYPEKTLLPQDVAIDPVTGLPVTTISTGGLLLATFRSELRLPLFGPLTLAAFHDVGDLFESGRFSLRTRTPLAGGGEVVRRLAQGSGIGVRVATPIGPLAIDLALPLDARDPGATDPQVHFSVGAF